MFSSLLFVSAVLAGTLQVQAAPAPWQHPSLGPSNAKCVRSTYTVSSSSKNVQFKNVTASEDESDTTFVVSLQQSLLTETSASARVFANEHEDGTVEVHQNFSMSGTLCTPYNNKAPKTVQLLIHGFSGDSSYWNFQSPEVPDDHSFVVAAANAGYTTFRYDRLGTGHSEHPSDAYNVVQAATDVSIATQITKMLRSGAIGNTSFNTIVAVGHSYGSIQINALTQTPGLVDHAVLTGFSANATHFPAYLATTGFSPAHAVIPKRFGDLPSGYLVTAAPQTFQLGFLFSPGFSQAALALARRTEQPVAQGVIFTILTIPAPAPDFKGSVAVVTGLNDFVFCAGDCSQVPAGSGLSSIPDGAKVLYPNASNFTTYLPENTGHAISVQYSAGPTYRWIQNHIASL